ncbi:MAG: sugar ABC transporter substrate-binding protein [Thioploca sp.]|nr:sugar ABC transporter substrate-binding protein [Thioploca sp.]
MTISQDPSYFTLIKRFGVLLITTLIACESEPDPYTNTHNASPVTPIAKPLLTTTTFNLSPWQQANINWRQFAGSQLSVLADAQPAFMALRPYLPLFEQLTGIWVGYQNVEQDEMRQKRRLDLASGGGIYDVVPIGITSLGEAYENGWLEWLDPYLADPTLTDNAWYDFTDLSPNSLVLCQWKGHLLSIPFDFSAPILFYRKDLFKKYHIELPDTYEAVVSMKRKLQAAMDKDGLKEIYAFTTRTGVGAGLNTWTVIPIIRAYGGEMFDAQWRPIFNSPQAVKALEVYRDMVTGYGSPPDTLTLHFYDIRTRFKEGKLASTILASHFFSEINSANKSPIWDRWDAIPTPRGPVARATSPWAWAFAINAASSNKKAAWLFIQWITSKDTARLLTTGGAPARLSVWESDHYTKLNPPGLVNAVKWIMEKSTLDLMQSGIPEFTETGLVASKAFSEIFYGAPVQQTLDQAVVQVEPIMAKGPTRRAAAGIQ